jgi:hypothetical protein
MYPFAASATFLASISNQYIFAISSIPDSLSLIILLINILAIIQKFESASSKYCNTANLPLFSISSSSVKFHTYHLISSSLRVNAYFDPILLVLNNLMYHSLAILINVVIVPSFSIFELSLLNLAKNL